MPARFHNLVRPCLDGLSLLVFLFALATALWHLKGPGCGGWSCTDTARSELREAAGALEQLAHSDPHALAAALVDAEPLSALRSRIRSTRLEVLDPWRRPFVLVPLAGDWLLELRTRGQDGRLHTADDQYFRMSRQGDVVFDEELQPRPVPAVRS